MFNSNIFYKLLIYNCWFIFNIHVWIPNDNTSYLIPSRTMRFQFCPAGTKTTSKRPAARKAVPNTKEMNLVHWPWNLGILGNQVSKDIHILYIYIYNIIVINLKSYSLVCSSMFCGIFGGSLSHFPTVSSPRTRAPQIAKRFSIALDHRTMIILRNTLRKMYQPVWMYEYVSKLFKIEMLRGPNSQALGAPMSTTRHAHNHTGSHVHIGLPWQGQGATVYLFWFAKVLRLQLM